MTTAHSYDPVTALDEAAAEGETARLFADIRQTMRVPLVTSIWRGLADMEDGLGRVWAATKPIYATGEPDRALARSIASAGLPRPEPLPPTAAACVGLKAGDLAAARSVIAAYNRSNGLNLMALAALISPAVGPACRSVPDRGDHVAAWPTLPVLLRREDIAADTWSLIEHVNAFGASGPGAVVATLWRHLAHWPALLALVHGAFAPLQANGSLGAASRRMVALAAAEGSGMAHARPASTSLPARARETVEAYVGDATQLARMVTIGHSLARWLEA